MKFFMFLVFLFGFLFPALSHASQPNIIVILTDDQRDADPLDRMPNTQALLADQGLRFTNSFVVNSICCASRTTFLTGQYSHNNGVWNNVSLPDHPGGFVSFAGDNNTLPVWLHAAGYRTGLIGKYLNGYGDVNQTYIPPGWDYWWGVLTLDHYQEYYANDNGTVRYYGDGDANYQTDVISGLVQSFVAASNQPFFLEITGVAPHGGFPGGAQPPPPSRYIGYFSDLPLPQPPSFNEGNISDKPDYLQSIPKMHAPSINLATGSYRARARTLLAVDDMVGALVAELQSLGELDNTYIIFMSDNGYMNGEHRLFNTKQLDFEESLRVPLVIRGPGVPVGETRSQLVTNLDVPATIVELSGAVPGRLADGRSLVPMFTDASAPWRSEFLIEGNDSIELYPAFGYFTGVRSTTAMYAEHTDLHSVYLGNEFYDLVLDPYELEGSATRTKYKSTVATMKAQLSSLSSCVGGGCWVP